MEKTTHMALLTQEFTNDAILLERNPSYTVFWDTCPCYDRILPNLANMSLTRLGAHPNIGKMIAKTSMDMKHKLRTIHGISTNYIEREKGEIWTGVGQGCAASGPIWLSIEVPMLDAFRDMERGTDLRSPNREIHFRNHVNAFVDDNVSTRTYKNITSRDIIEDDAMTATRDWAKLLSASGGQLCTEKSTLVINTWVWKNNQFIMERKNNKSGGDTKKLEPDDAVKYLGVHQNIMADSTTEFSIQEKNVINSVPD